MGFHHKQVRCVRCGYELATPDGTCARCFPVKAVNVESVRVAKGERSIAWMRANGRLVFKRSSPTIDVLDLDHSALRALEEIAHG